MTDIQGISGLSEQAVRTAMQSPEHLKRWLRASGREFITFDAIDLVDALPWPAGIQALQQIINAYRDQRRTVDTGRTEQITDPATKQLVTVPVMKDEVLEYDELVRLRAHVDRLITLRKGKDNASAN